MYPALDLGNYHRYYQGELLRQAQQDRLAACARSGQPRESGRIRYTRVVALVGSLLLAVTALLAQGLTGPTPPWP
jgi:hypothetical protein